MDNKKNNFKSDSILLINPPMLFKQGFRRPSVSIPLGVLYTATAMLGRKKVVVKDYLGHPRADVHQSMSRGSVSSKDYYLGLSLEDIKTDLKKSPIPDIVGISCSYLSHTYQTIQSIIDFIKEISPTTKIILGGSGLIKDIQLIFKNVDLFYYGEAEGRLISILEGKDIKEIKGLLFKNQDRFSFTGSPDYLKTSELDDYAHLDYSLVDIDKYIYFNQKGIHSRFSKTARSISFITSRGCPFDCCFCMIKSVQGQTWRPYSAEAVFKNLKELKHTYGIEHLHIEDDNFALDIPRFIKIIKMIKNLGMSWDPSNGLYAQHFSEKEIHLMKESGCQSIKIAPESGSQRIIDQVISGKPIKLDKIREIAKWSHSAGLKIMGFLIIGFPQETEDDLQKTLDFALELKELYGVRWTVSLVRPFPGTRFRDYCEKNNLLTTRDEIEILGSATAYNLKHRLFSQDYLKSISDKISAEWVKIN